jgi:Mlc titration factor MtfA (ptsG expression regulator)
LFDGRAAKKPSELFAYATEKFFACPAQLLAAHPALYALLAAYYAQDPFLT